MTLVSEFRLMSLSVLYDLMYPVSVFNERIKYSRHF